MATFIEVETIIGLVLINLDNVDCISSNAETNETAISFTTGPEDYICSVEPYEVIKSKIAGASRSLFKNAEQTMPLEVMDLSIRSYNCLKRAGIKTLQDLSKCKISDLMRVRNLGRRSLQEVVDKCNEYGVCIVDDTEGQ